MIQTRSSQLMLQTGERHTEPLQALSLQIQAFTLHQRCLLMNKVLRGKFFSLMSYEKPFIQELAKLRDDATITEKQCQETLAILIRIRAHAAAARMFIFELENDILKALKPYGLIEMLAQLDGEANESIVYLSQLKRLLSGVSPEVLHDIAVLSTFLREYLPENYQTFMSSTSMLKAFMEHATVFMLELEREAVKRG